MDTNCSYFSELENDHFVSEVGAKVVTGANGKLDHLCNTGYISVSL